MMVKEGELPLSPYFRLLVIYFSFEVQPWKHLQYHTVRMETLDYRRNSKFGYFLGIFSASSQLTLGHIFQQRKAGKPFRKILAIIH